MIPASLAAALTGQPPTNPAQNNKANMYLRLFLDGLDFILFLLFYCVFVLGISKSGPCRNSFRTQTY